MYYIDNVPPVEVDYSNPVPLSYIEGVLQAMEAHDHGTLQDLSDEADGDELWAMVTACNYAMESVRFAKMGDPKAEAYAARVSQWADEEGHSDFVEEFSDKRVEG